MRNIFFSWPGGPGNWQISSQFTATIDDFFSIFRRPSPFWIALIPTASSCTAYSAMPRDISKVTTSRSVVARPFWYVLSTIRDKLMLTDNQGWRIIHPGGESRAFDLWKIVSMILMVDSEWGLIKMADNWVSSVSHFLNHAANLCLNVAGSGLLEPRLVPSDRHRPQS